MENKFARLGVLIFSAVLSFSCAASKEMKCDLNILTESLPEYIYNGPISFAEAQKIYEEEASPFETSRVKEAWEKFLEVTDKDDCIYIFNTPEEDWKMLRGAKGLISTDGDKILEAFIIMKS